MWTDLDAEVAEQFEQHRNLVLAWADHEGNAAPIYIGLSLEAHVEMRVTRYLCHERMDRWVMGREIAREEAILGSYFREFTAEVLKRRAAARLAARGRWTAQAGACSKYGCTKAPVEGRRMCKPHAQQAAAAVQRSKARRKALAR